MIEMDKKYVSNSKRIVEFYNLIFNETTKQNLYDNRRKFEDFEIYHKMLSSKKAREFLNDYLRPFDFEISAEYTSDYNLGYNNRFEIIDHDVIDGMESHIGYICINHYIYSLMFSVYDFDNNRLGPEWFEINAGGLHTKPNSDWKGWEQYSEQYHYDWDLTDLEKEKEIRSLIHQCIDKGLLTVANGHIMVIKETKNHNPYWYPATYEEVIKDLKDPLQFNSLLNAVNEKLKISLDEIPQEYSYPAFGIQLNLEAVNQEYCYYLDQNQETLYAIDKTKIKDSSSIYDQLKKVIDKGNVDFTEQTPDVRVEATEGFSENRIDELFLQYHNDPENFDYTSQHFQEGYEANIDEILEEQEDELEC